MYTQTHTYSESSFICICIFHMVILIHKSIAAFVYEVEVFCIETEILRTYIVQNSLNGKNLQNKVSIQNELYGGYMQKKELQ